jgi:hypothetical protein
MGLFYYSDGLGQRCASPEHPLLVNLSIDLLEKVVTLKLQSPQGGARATIILNVDELRDLLLEVSLLKR